MVKLTLLKEDQIWGDKALEVMKKYGTKAETTDLAILLGGFSFDELGKTFPVAPYWTLSSVSGNVGCVCRFGGRAWENPTSSRLSVRPALSPSAVSEICSSEKMNKQGIIAKYGEYPQTVAELGTNILLGDLFSRGHLHTTGKKYTIAPTSIWEDYTHFKAIPYAEYEYNGERYVRISGRCSNDDQRLSTGEKVERWPAYWVRVEPIEWLVDESGWWVSEKSLFSGIPFDTNEKYLGNFGKTFLGRYLNSYFAREMKVSRNSEHALPVKVTDSSLRLSDRSTCREHE